MKTRVTLLMLLGVFIAGCASQQAETTSTGENPLSGAPPLSTRDMVLVCYKGIQSPGPGWENTAVDTGGGQRRGAWERRVTVKLRTSRAKGTNVYGLSLSELGTLPGGEVWIGPVHGASGIGRGVTIGNMPTSSGPMIMLLLDPAKDVLEWSEPQ